jgi:5-methylcytosine-specific restriction enzyme subunit McrC
VTTAYEPLTAWANREPRRIDPEHAQEIARCDGIRVELRTAPDQFLLSTDSRVGVLVGAGWELRIEPRLPIPHLLYLLAYSMRPAGWRDLVASFGERRDLVSALANGFAFHAERALEQGVLRGYAAIEERRHVLRGRIRFGDQLSRIPGLPMPLEVSYDDHTPNVVENRMVLTAAEQLLRLPRLSSTARRRLLHLRALLEEVEPLPPGREVTAPPTTRLNVRYESALALAELILRGRSLVHSAGGTPSTAFLFDMNEVFERYLYARLRDSFKPYGGEVRSSRIGHLDHERGIPLEPDITWWRGGVCRGVIDAKYKSLFEGSTMPNADAYQMLAYCIALRLPRGFLVYAKDAGAGIRRHTVVVHGYEIHVRSVDVTLEPRDLEAQFDTIAAEVAASARAAAA